MKLKTIENPLAHCVIGMMSEPEEPTFERVQEMLLDFMIQQENDESLDKGTGDGLLRFLNALADGDCEFLSGKDAERAMIDGYTVGQVIALDAMRSSQIKAVKAEIDNGNSGWWWPHALTYKGQIEDYPRSLCERYGLLLGYKHGSEQKELARYFASPEGKAMLKKKETPVDA